MSAALLIFILFLIANFPWINDRVFLVYNLKKVKPGWVRIGELVIYYFIGLLIGIAFEIRYSGDVYQQGWEFFVTTFCLFVVLAVPGMVYRFQWLPMQEKFK